MKIRKILASFFVLTMLFGCSSGCGAAYIEQPRYINSSQHVNHMMNAVVALIESSPGSGSIRSFCSAFFVEEDKLATAAHCLVTNRNIQIMPGIFEQQVNTPQVGTRIEYVDYLQFQAAQRNIISEPHTAIVAAFDVTNDVAILQLAPTSPRATHILSLDTSAISIGEQVYVVGHPGTLHWILTEGIVSQVLRGPNGAITQVSASAQIFFGNSGGPLMNNRGQVIGSVSEMAFRQAHLGIFVPSNRISALLNSLRPINQRH
jgi:hypothetical protein